MFVDELKVLLNPVVTFLKGRELDSNLQSELDKEFSTSFQGDVLALCKKGIASGEFCSREAGGIKYGRVVKPDGFHGFSIDIVEMDDIAGPFHVHPNGEIDLILPLDSNATFDGKGQGWMVYPAGSAHRPTTKEGNAIVLYLLPDGAIEFVNEREYEAARTGNYQP